MEFESSAGHGTVSDKKDKLMADLKSVVADANDLLKEVTNATAEEFGAVRTRVEGRVGDARSRLERARIAAANTARGAAHATNESMRENPWTTLVVGAAVGLIVAYLTSRR